MPRDAAYDDHVVAIGDIILQGLVFVELGAELIKVGDPDSGPQADPALLRFKIAEKDLEERGLAGAVGPDNAHLIGGWYVDCLQISGCRSPQKVLDRFE